MAIRKINYKSDFKVIITIDESLSGYPFRFTFFVGRSRYVCSYDGTTYTNCEVVDTTHVQCALDDHDFPQGRLCVDSCFYLTDDTYADGSAAVHTREMLDVILTDGRTDEFDNAEVEYSVLLTALRGYSAYQLAVQNGYTGTEEEWLVSLCPYIGDNGNWWIGDTDTEIQADYSEEETARVNAELARQDAEAARVLAEQAREDAEDLREQAEAARVAAEQEREDAETARGTAYTAAEAARNESYAAAEAARDALYTQAENARDASFAAKETERDAAVAAAAACAETLEELDETKISFVDGSTEYDEF